MLESKNTIIVGHGTGSDVRHLSDECDRFHFEPIDFDYLDTKAIADLLLDSDIPKNLKGLHDRFCGDKGNYQWHRSLDDACMTRDVFEYLFCKAKKENVNILENEELAFNSLRCVYGKLADVAKKGDGYFSCNFDVPIIGILVQCNYVNGEDRKKEAFHLYYDYAVDRYLKNAIGYKKDMTVDMKRVIKMVHTAETANKSMLLMAKMKFGYKNKDFPEIKREALPYSENIKYLLAKEYVGLLESSDTRKGANDSLIIGNKIYIPTEHAFENNLFSERLLLPVLAETNR